VEVSSVGSPLMGISRANGMSRQNIGWGQCKQIEAKMKYDWSAGVVAIGFGQEWKKKSQNFLDACLWCRGIIAP
jgi:hypothetical protein